MPSDIIATTKLERAFGGKNGKSAGQVKAVDGIDLRVPEGSIYGFLGPNGAGKTTTIRMLLGLIRPTGGEVTLFGQPLRRAALARVGALVETPSYYPHLTGRENVSMIAGMRSLPDSEVRRVLAIVDLEGPADRLARHYSLGMLQRLGLAIALLGQPRLLILDEPTNGLDPAGIHEIRALIRDLPTQHGITVFVSSHLLSEVEQIASHIGVIQSGKLVFQGTAASLRAEYAETAVIVTDHPDQTCAWLSGHGWKATLDGTADSRTALKIEANGEPDVAMIVQQLVQAGTKVYHASLQKPSLEDIFLQMTRQP